ARQHPRRPRRLRGHRRLGRVRRPGPAGTGAGGARRRRPVPRLPVPGGDPGREQHLLPAQRAQRPAQGARPGRAGLDAVPQAGAREAGRAAPEGRTAAPRRQRGLFRRREEAQRDLPAGRARAEAGDPRRDRLGPGHRRAQDRGRRRQRPAHRRALVPGDHPLPAPAGLHQAGRGPRAGRRPHRPDRRPGTGAGTGEARLRLAQGPGRPGTGGVMAALLESFRQGFDALRAPEAQELGPGRRAALDALLADGLPGPREEAWKYTPLRALERRGFAPADATAPAFDAGVLEGIPAPRLVFANGRFDAALSALAGLPAGASAERTAQVLERGEPRDANFLLRRYERRDEVFARANAALAEEGAVVRLDAGVRLPAPLHLVFVGVAQEGDRAWHLRHFIDLREGAALDIV